MKNKYSAIRIAAQIWFVTNAIAVFILTIYTMIIASPDSDYLPFGVIAIYILTLPMLLILNIGSASIKMFDWSKRTKIRCLIFTCFWITACYGTAIGISDARWKNGDFHWRIFFSDLVIFTGIFFSCSMIALIILRKNINTYFSQ